MISTLFIHNVVDSELAGGVRSRTFDFTRLCNKLSADLEGIKLDMAIVESNHDKIIEPNSQEISQTKSRVEKSLKEAKSTNDEYKAFTDDMLRLINEDKLISNTTKVLTSELERSKNFHTEYDSYSDRQNTCNVEVVTKNADKETKDVIGDLTNNLPNNQVHQLETPSMHYGKKSECHG